MMEAEERPVADRLDGVPTPAECERLIGHDHALNQLANQYAAGRLHHGWLISGPRGVGKASFAFSMAKYLLSHVSADNAPHNFDANAIDHSTARQVAMGAHPNLLHLTRPWDDKTKKFKTQLSIEEVRRTHGFYGLTAGAGGWRITIVDSADDMNASAANALLKILEEPPKRSLFFVLTHSPGRLLPTIRSRCQNLPLHPLSYQDLLAVLAQVSPKFSEGERERAAQLAEGSARRAIQLLAGDVLNEYKLFESMMEHAAPASSKDWVAVHKIADSLAKRGNEQAFELFIDLVLGWISSQVRNHVTLDGQTRPASVAGWAQVWENANRSVHLANAYNLDKKQVILSLFGNLFEQQKPKI